MRKGEDEKMRKGEKKEYQLKPAGVYQTWQSLDV